MRKHPVSVLISAKSMLSNYFEVKRLDEIFTRKHIMSTVVLVSDCNIWFINWSRCGRTGGHSHSKAYLEFTMRGRVGKSSSVTCGHNDRNHSLSLQQVWDLVILLQTNFMGKVFWHYPITWPKLNFCEQLTLTWKKVVFPILTFKEVKLICKKQMIQKYSFTEI